MNTHPLVTHTAVPKLWCQLLHLVCMAMACPVPYVLHAGSDMHALVALQVGVNLGKPGYLEHIDKETADIDVQVLFNNAGYMLTGFFEST